MKISLTWRGRTIQVVKRGWSALLSVQEEDGSIGWTQQIESQPDSVARNNVQLYGAGAFLQARPPCTCVPTT